MNTDQRDKICSFEFLCQKALASVLILGDCLIVQLSCLKCYSFGEGTRLPKSDFFLVFLYADDMTLMSLIVQL